VSVGTILGVAAGNVNGGAGDGGVLATSRVEYAASELRSRIQSEDEDDDDEDERRDGS